MHVLQVNTQDSQGGAAQIMQQLHNQYAKLGFDPAIASAIKYTNDPKSYIINNKYKQNKLTQLLISAAKKSKKSNLKGTWQLGNALEKIANPTKAWDRHRGREDFHQHGAWNLLNITGKKIDLLHLHNLHGKNYFDLTALPYLSHQLPTFITMHDAWLLAGHCAHSFDCNRWQTGCGKCPDLTIPPAINKDQTAYNFNRKSKIYQQSNLHIITPSKWLMNKVEKSMLRPAAASMQVIPNGIDTEIFKPNDKLKARKSRNLPDNAFILLFAAHGVKQSPWKDYKTIEHAIKIIAAQNPNRKIHMIAMGEDAQDQIFDNVKIQFIPYVKDTKIVAQYYQAADLYLHGAKIDTFPNVILEAMACGLPVIATDVGGINEQIIVNQTGYLSPPANPFAMAHYANLIINDQALQKRLSQHAVQTIIKKYTLKQQVNAYVDLYQKKRDTKNTTSQKLSAA